MGVRAEVLFLGCLAVVPGGPELHQHWGHEGVAGWQKRLNRVISFHYRARLKRVICGGQEGRNEKHLAFCRRCVWKEGMDTQRTEPGHHCKCRNWKQVIRADRRAAELRRKQRSQRR